MTFRKITEQVFASPQIGPIDVLQAAREGIVLIVNNRPEDESDDQVPGPEIEAAARAAGLDYVALAYCRSGTRSTLLWALAEASRGEHPEVLAAQAAVAGYDVAPIRQLLDVLHARA